MKKFILIKVSGTDKPGVTSKLTSLIAKQNIRIADMGQSVTHGLLSLSILIESEGTESQPVLKDLLFEAKQIGMNLDFQVLDELDPRDVYDELFIVSCVQPNGINAKFISEIATYCANQKLNILDIENRSFGDNFSSLDLKIVGKDINFPEIKKNILDIAYQSKIDLAIVRDNVFRFNKRLIIFDMDSTLIQTEVIEELAKLAGSFEKVANITNKAMNGELDFTQSLRERVSTLKGLHRSQLQEILNKIPLTTGVDTFIRIVKSLGFKTAVISGGFSFFTDYFKDKLGLDYAFANSLEFDNDDKLTGDLTGTIVDAEQKATLLELLAQQESISLEQVVAIGDGANDLKMLAKAGMGIAFQAKEIVKTQADHHLSYGNMASILSFLGIPEDYTQKRAFTN